MDDPAGGRRTALICASDVYAPAATPSRCASTRKIRNNNFQPSSGLLTEVRFPSDARLITGSKPGRRFHPSTIRSLAKLLVAAATREEALGKMASALDKTRIDGIETNLDYLARFLRRPSFAPARFPRGFLKDFAYRPRTSKSSMAGTQTTVQDYPGRIGYWAVGVPPSGPMDSLAFRLGNRLLGNPEDAAGLEMHAHRPTLRFTPQRNRLTGAPMRARLRGEAVSFYEPVTVSAGETLALDAIEGNGCRTYLAVLGGLDVPQYLG